MFLIIALFFIGRQGVIVVGSPDHERLYKDLLRNHNKLIRPTPPNSNVLNVSMGLKLSQLMDVDEVDQIITTSVRVIQTWNDHRMAWNSSYYGGISHIDIPCDEIWLPDILLYNNADGDYQIAIKTKVRIHHDGTIQWEPPMIYKSYCRIDVKYFPYDKQTCHMKFGSWTFDGDSLNLLPMRGFEEDNKKIQIGMDLSEYMKSVEWDILEASANRHLVIYPCCKEPYLDITFTLVIRRRTLFYTVNLMAPCVVISYLTMFAFYLPTDSGEKVTICMSILLSLTVFNLVLVEIIPQTSLEVWSFLMSYISYDTSVSCHQISLIGRYLLFTMCMVSFSIIASILVTNCHLRNSSHKMPNWVRKIFVGLLPRLLRIERPTMHRFNERDLVNSPSDYSTYTQFELQRLTENSHLEEYCDFEFSDYFLDCELSRKNKPLARQIKQIVNDVNFIAENIEDDAEKAKEGQDWKYVGMVLDRIFFIIFFVACIAGTVGIILNVPHLYENEESIPRLCQTPQATGSDDQWMCVFRTDEDVQF